MTPRTTTRTHLSQVYITLTTKNHCSCCSHDTEKVHISWLSRVVRHVTRCKRECSKKPKGFSNSDSCSCSSQDGDHERKWDHETGTILCWFLRSGALGYVRLLSAIFGTNLKMSQERGGVVTQLTKWTRWRTKWNIEVKQNKACCDQICFSSLCFRAYSDFTQNH